MVIVPVQFCHSRAREGRLPFTVYIVWTSQSRLRCFQIGTLLGLEVDGQKSESIRSM